MPALDIRLADLPPDRRYKILGAIIVPRPIALVTSIDARGIVNCAPYSFFNCFSEAPPLIALGLQRRPEKTLKDTTANIHATGEFVVNMVDEALAEGMNISAIDMPPGISEITEAGLELAPSTDIKVPRIKSAPAALECTWKTSLSFNPDRELLLGEVLRVHMRDGLMDEKFNIDFPAYKPVGRLFADLYAYQRQIFALKRVPWTEWKAKGRESLKP